MTELNKNRMRLEHIAEAINRLQALDDWIDIGLPSGILWATRNVGASSPTDYGDYYAWGETSPKHDYKCSNYRYAMIDKNSGDDWLTKYCNKPSYGYKRFVDGLITLQPSDDAATVNYGGHTPTIDEWAELLLYSTARLMTLYNGVTGMCFTGPNGNRLFLPATRFRSENLLVQHFGCFYWSSSLDTTDPKNARVCGFGCNNPYKDKTKIFVVGRDGSVYYDRIAARSYGFTVRAVR